MAPSTVARFGQRIFVRRSSGFCFLFLAERRVLEGLLLNNFRWRSYLIRIEGKALEICEANVWIKVK